MRLGSRARRWRHWFPFPTADGGIELVRWTLLEANRLAVVGVLATLVFGVLMLIGTVWTFEMQSMLTETSTVQTILNTLLSGMILLVSIVVSINSIVLSYEIRSVEMEEERIQGTVDYRRELGDLTETGESPSDPSSFLALMSGTIRQRAATLRDDMEGGEAEIDEEILDYISDVAATAENIDEVTDTTGAEFAVLWKGMEFDVGPYMDRSRSLMSDPTVESPGDLRDRFDDLLQTFELFSVGKEYFKTLYYTQEVSKLSRTLLVVALPAIVFNASTILAIGAGVTPEVWLLGLPPIQSFVFTAFTVSLIPYLVLTSYMLRLATVAKLTSSAGIFSLE